MRNSLLRLGKPAMLFGAVLAFAKPVYAGRSAEEMVLEALNNPCAIVAEYSSFQGPRKENGEYFPSRVGMDRFDALRFGLNLMRKISDVQGWKLEGDELLDCSKEVANRFMWLYDVAPKDGFVVYGSEVACEENNLVTGF